MKALLVILAGFLFLSGCTTLQKVKKIEAGKVNLVCIAEHKEVRENVLKTIQEGLTNHGVKYKVIPGSYQIKNRLWIPTIQKEQVVGCDSLLFYVANWNWDLAMYMRFANLWMTTPDLQQNIGSASYDARASLNKFINARKKILELVDGLFVEYKNVGPASINTLEAMPVTPSPKNPNAPSRGSISEKLRELQALKNDGLISESDYQQKKMQLLDKF